MQHTDKNVSDSLLIDGKTRYPKKQFHSSPSWVWLHLSGITPPQYLRDVLISNFTAKIIDVSISFHVSVVIPYLMPLLMVSVGEQLTASTASVHWYCLLSRNQPESERPRTCIPVWPSPSSNSATRSTFRRTPVPPALHVGQTHGSFL